jgi:site-specific recombinase XerD
VIQALSPDEVQKLLTALPSKTMLGCRNRAILMMLLDTGMRVSVLANLSLDNLQTDTGAILVKHGKGGKQRVVMIRATAQKALWLYITVHRKGNSDRLFLARSGDSRESEGTQVMVRALGRRADVPNIHVHGLRHTFAISFLRAGGNIFTLKYLLGHSSLAMVQDYLGSLNADDAMNAHRRK